MYQHKTLNGFMVERLREKIVSGELPAGSKIDQNAVAEEFGVSRMPVREALRHLDAEGFVTLLSHRGAIVSQLSEDDIVHAYEIRAVLSGLAAKLSVPHFDDETVPALEALAEAMKTAEAEEWIRLNQEFHDRIERPSGVERLLELIERLTQQCRPYLQISVHLAHAQQPAEEEHERILRACREADEDELERAVRDHLSAWGRVVASYVGRARAEDKRNEAPAAAGGKRKGNT
jgi:DNA-binding GntR family transcriptional regulator